MVTDPMAELTLRLPPELHQAVKDAARAADLSMAQWIRRAIRAGLKPVPVRRKLDMSERVEPWPSNLLPNVGDQTRAGA